MWDRSCSTRILSHLAVMTISSLTPLLPTPCRRSRVQPKVEALVFLAWVEPRGGSLPSPANGRCWILGPSKKLATGALAKQTRGRNMLRQRKRKYGAKKEVERGAETAKTWRNCKIIGGSTWGNSFELLLTAKWMVNSAELLLQWPGAVVMMILKIDQGVDSFNIKYVKESHKVEWQVGNREEPGWWAIWLPASNFLIVVPILWHTPRLKVHF